MIPAVNTRKTPSGRLTYENGDVYVGPWSDVTVNGKLYRNVPHGDGLKRLQDGRVLKGSFVLGQISGGSCSYPDGSRYTGKFWENKPGGQGTFHYKSICTCTGRFEKGIFQKGTIQWENPRMEQLPALIDLVAQDLQTNDIRKIARFVKQICAEFRKLKS